MTAGDRVRWLLRGVGQVLITLGVVVLLFCVYELRVTNLYTEDQQRALGHQLDRTWAAAPAPTPGRGGPVLAAFDAGKGFARIYLPSLGRDQVHVVVEGVTRADLKKGPGHYPGTAAPGAVGNVVISGHRTTYGAPFNRLDELHKGDAIVIETQGFFFTYRMLTSSVVKPSAIEVTYPVPGERGAVPHQRLLTLTTCSPKYSAKTRLIVLAVLESQLAKRPGLVPPALAGGR